MKRIFLTLAAVSLLLLIAAFVLGLKIGDMTTVLPSVRTALRFHFLTALAATCFAVFVHSLVLTYLIGTGRWMEETGQAYQLDETCRLQNQAMKSRIMPGIVGCILLLILTGAFGAAIDPASAVDFKGWAGIGGATIHLLLSSTAIGFSLIVYLWEYQAIGRNQRLIDTILTQVQQIREYHRRSKSSSAKEEVKGQT